MASPPAAGIETLVAKESQGSAKCRSILLLAPVGQLHEQVAFLRRHATIGAVQRGLAAATVESAALMGQLVWDGSHGRTGTKVSPAHHHGVNTRPVSGGRGRGLTGRRGCVGRRRGNASVMGAKPPVS